jgi:hypothetical protein
MVLLSHLARCHLRGTLKAGKPQDDEATRSRESKGSPFAHVAIFMHTKEACLGSLAHTASYRPSYI